MRRRRFPLRRLMSGSARLRGNSDTPLNLAAVLCGSRILVLFFNQSPGAIARHPASGAAVAPGEHAPAGAKGGAHGLFGPKDCQVEEFCFCAGASARSQVTPRWEFSNV